MLLYRLTIPDTVAGAKFPLTCDSRSGTLCYIRYARRSTMLYVAIWSIIGGIFAIIGLLVAFGALRVWLGSSDAYEMVRSVSKGMRSSAFGDIRQPSGDRGAVFTRGIAYTILKDGSVEFRAQAKIDRESIRDTSI